MVLIIRNNRILSSRQSRIKKFFSYVRRDQQTSQQRNNPPDQNKEPLAMSLVTVLGTLFLYSIAMFTLPFAAFYGVNHFVTTEFDLDRFATNCISVFAAVITVNLIISCYIYQALHEPDNASEIGDITDQPSKQSLNEKID